MYLKNNLFPCLTSLIWSYLLRSSVTIIAFFLCVHVSTSWYQVVVDVLHRTSRLVGDVHVEYIHSEDLPCRAG